jgi:hypothetical protein
MSKLAEVHDDLSTIHAILLGQRQVAQNAMKSCGFNRVESAIQHAKIETINDLLLEIEAAGVVWPDNVVDGLWPAAIEASNKGRILPGDIKLNPWEKDRG